MNRNQTKRRGLVLLVVLGMLALFSLLTVTYVVFAGQSKSTNVALSKRYVQGGAPWRPVFEEAIKQLIRGTEDTGSELYGQSLLGDLFGDNETSNLPFSANMFARPMTLASVTMTHAWDSLERPMLLNNRFLRIPVARLNPSWPPVENDVLTGRIITFPDGQGPLGGLSFHIIRYIGDQTSLSAEAKASSFSITIDLQENDLSKVKTLMVGTGGGNQTTMTGTILDWALMYPQMVGTPASDTWARGVYLCYNTVGLNPMLPVLADPYVFFINAVPVNSHGAGIGADGSSQYHVLNTAAAPNVIDPGINIVPVGLQPRSNKLTTTGTLIDPDSNLTYDSVNNTYRFNTSGAFRLGDTDEPFDVSDFNNAFLANRPSAAANSGDIMPSFHRTALLNYLVNFKSPAAYNENEFWAVLRRIELATMRPLGMIIRTPNAPPAFMDPNKVVNVGGVLKYISNPEFNPNFAANNSLTDPVGTNGKRGIPVLEIDISSNWATNWPTAIGQGRFTDWMNSLMVGKWDVDNLASGIPDSVFIDAGLPLQKTPNGVLLKALVAYYVECMDGKLDVNAVGGTAQASAYGNYPNLFAQPTAYGGSVTTASPSPFALGNLYSTGGSIYLPQGLGYGSADLSLRHIFSKTASGIDNGEVGYINFLRQRYGSSATPIEVGTSGADTLTHLTFRESRPVHAHYGLPGLPLSVRGRASMAIDRLGNPIIHNYGTPNSLVESEYEAKLIASPYMDTPFTIAEWEKMYRVGDADHNAMPGRLQAALGETDSSNTSVTLRHEITARSRHLVVPKITARHKDFKNGSNQAINPPTSFLQLVNTVRELKGLTTVGDDQYKTLFPLEFHRGQAMNINRPFGNGIDDNSSGEIDEPTEVAIDSSNISGTGQNPIDPTGVTSSGVLAGAQKLDYSAGLTVSGLDPTNPTYPYNGVESRQLYARHLYCLAQLLVPQEYNFPNIDRAYWKDLILTASTGDVPAKQKYVMIRSRILAQWAANIVDFRDADSSMTRFPYDPDPFDYLNNGATIDWNPNRNVNGNASLVHVVWGMEQPELLLTESLAFHDLRVRKDPAATPARWDQFRFPQGSLFLELYCPRTTEVGLNAVNSTQLPGVSPSLYTTNSSGDVVLNVSKVSPTDSAGNAYPVWRVYLSGPIDKQAKKASGVTDRDLTPNGRLTASAAANRNESTKFDLTYQLPVSNNDTTGGNLNGLKFDWAATNPIAQPDPATSRVIFFAPKSSTFGLVPGVNNIAQQVFYNRSSTSLQLHGNQYLVVGPRNVTYLGSDQSSKTSASGKPGNVPSKHLIDISAGTWASMFDKNGTDYRNPYPFDAMTNPNGSANIREAVTMVAAADRPSTWSNTVNLPYIGINVSEPLPGSATYYQEPTVKINTVASSGFDTINPDGYYDYGTGVTAPSKPPFDSGATGPLSLWDNNFDGTGAALQVAQLGSNDVVQPGTAIDWSTAYLQRLADPNLPWDATHNPYITVDWISVDLTVFSGEEAASDFTAPGEMRLASRQKSGQMIQPTTLDFDNADAANKTGWTFMSPLTHAPRRTTADAAAPTFLKHAIKGEDAQLLNTDPTKQFRPSKATPANAGDRNFFADNAQSFATLGFLNSPYVLSAESAISGMAALPPAFKGSPGHPDPAVTMPTNKRSTWHPATVFWGNRPFVNNFEIAYVPLSGPSQLAQEFTASDSVNYYGPGYTKLSSGYPQDPRMPTTLLAPSSTVVPAADVTVADWAMGVMQPQWLQTANPGQVHGNVDPSAYYPYTHLLNFFQEMPEIYESAQKYRSSTTQYDITGKYRYRHPKDTSLALMFDLLDTPSAWGDVTNYESSVTFNPPAAGSQEFQVVSNTVAEVLRPFKAPYNRLSRSVEPGRVNINTMTEQNVLQGLWSNTLTPSDVDFLPYDPTPPFPQAGVDYDHNGDGIYDGGTRVVPNSITAVWNMVTRSRQGYDPITVPGLYTPPNQATTLAPFNPYFPTHFAGVFKPTSEAGMVPHTRSAIPLPTFPINTTSKGEQLELSLRATQYGMMDFYSRLNPTHATLMRAEALPVGDTQSVDTKFSITTGLATPSTRTLFFDSAAVQRHPFTDLYPMARLQKLVTERSNVFAIYTTIALFEFNPATGNIGKEYGVDSGEARRFKAFYVVDRSIPVGYRVGQDNNVENTILVRRILSE